MHQRVMQSTALTFASTDVVLSQPIVAKLKMVMIRNIMYVNTYIVNNMIPKTHISKLTSICSSSKIMLYHHNKHALTLCSSVFCWTSC